MYSVTVAIPAYNAQDTIEQSVRSVQAQTWPGPIEILVCDDGSTDATGSIVGRLAEFDPRVRLISNEVNFGRPYSRNRLVAEARGDFITWLDADDKKFPDMIKLQMEAFLSRRIQLGHERFMVYTNYIWDFPARSEFKIVSPNPGRDAVKSLLDGSFGGYLWLTLAKRSIISRALPFDLRLPRLQDLDFFINCAGNAVELYKINSNEPQCIYFKDDVGRSAREVYNCFTIIRKKHEYLIRQYGKHYRKELTMKHLGVAARFAESNGDKKLADRYMFRKSVVRRFGARLLA